MIEKILFLAAGYFLGNPQARNQLGNMATRSVQTGIDTLNKKGVDYNATEKIIETESKE